MADPVQGGRQFAFLLVDKFSMFSLAAPIDAFRSAYRLLGYDYYGWTTVSADGEAVNASNGLPSKIDTSGADIPPADRRLVAVGMRTEVSGKSKLMAALHNADRCGSE